MKLSQVFVNRESVTLYFAFCNSLRHLYIGFKDLLVCIIIFIIYIPLIILELLTYFIMIPFRIFKKE